MYFRLTPVCFFIAHLKMSSTTALSTDSASLVATAAEGPQPPAARSTDEAALAPSVIRRVSRGRGQENEGRERESKLMPSSFVVEIKKRMGRDSKRGLSPALFFVFLS